MAELRMHPNSGEETAALTADGTVVGGIKRTGREQFSAETSGRIPALDGVAGPSVQECWKTIVARVRQGGVVYHAEVKVTQDDGPIESA
jgi:hypothetical protein